MKMTTLEVSSIISKEEAKDVVKTLERHQKLINKILKEKDREWNTAQISEFFKLVAAENLLNFYFTHTQEGYAFGLERWKKAEEAAQKTYREENFI